MRGFDLAVERARGSDMEGQGEGPVLGRKALVLLSVIGTFLRF